MNLIRPGKVFFFFYIEVASRTLKNRKWPFLCGRSERMWNSDLQLSSLLILKLLGLP